MDNYVVPVLTFMRAGQYLWAGFFALHFIIWSGTVDCLGVSTSQRNLIRPLAWEALDKAFVWKRESNVNSQIFVPHGKKFF